MDEQRLLFSKFKDFPKYELISMGLISPIDYNETRLLTKKGIIDGDTRKGEGKEKTK